MHITRSRRLVCITCRLRITATSLNKMTLFVTLLSVLLFQTCCSFPYDYLNRYSQPAMYHQHSRQHQPFHQFSPYYAGNNGYTFNPYYVASPYYPFLPSNPPHYNFNGNCKQLFTYCSFANVTLLLENF